MAWLGEELSEDQQDRERSDKLVRDQSIAMIRSIRFLSD